jgi:hypothetical protein
MGNVKQVQSENVKETVHVEDLGVNVRPNLELLIKK